MLEYSGRIEGLVNCKQSRETYKEANPKIEQQEPENPNPTLRYHKRRYTVHVNAQTFRAFKPASNSAMYANRITSTLTSTQRGNSSGVVRLRSRLARAGIVAVKSHASGGRRP
ncbi:hypothetical protein NDU88_005837 [Pleurodeles waltl]|uniref:Ribosomal protein S11 n=1 Tax=Pleurodeles waltl TaxID=8319 RepID=A0AAV7WVV6_PLEWA|nr:hypothetical protein NDU88_005837 [Pleurodeles waltl]